MWLLLSSCSTAPKPLAPAKQLPADVTMNKEAGHGGRLKVVITFKGEELPFLLDTGAPVTLFATSLESKLGKSRGSSTVEFVGGEKQKTRCYVLPKIYLGKTRLMSGNFAFTYDFKDHSMGILGMDCLQHYCLQFDFQSGKMRFLNSDKLNTNDLGQCYPLTLRNGCPEIHRAGLVGNNPELLIDTGCNVDGITSKSTNRFDGLYLPESDWDGRPYSDLIVVALSNRANVLGMRFLGRHLVTLDFPHHRMFLKQTDIGAMDTTSSTDDSESAQKSGLRFLMGLKQAGELPGWTKGSHDAVFFQKPQTPDDDSATFTFWKPTNSVSYHYEIARKSKSIPWKLQKAWLADQNDKTIKEFSIP